MNIRILLILSTLLLALSSLLVPVKAELESLYQQNPQYQKQLQRRQQTIQKNPLYQINQNRARLGLQPLSGDVFSDLYTVSVECFQYNIASSCPLSNQLASECDSFCRRQAIPGQDMFYNNCAMMCFNAGTAGIPKGAPRPYLSDSENCEARGLNGECMTVEQRDRQIERWIPRP